MSHKYKLGQHVRRSGGGPVAPRDQHIGRGEVCEVIRLMPADERGQVSYRIKAGFSERAVREDEIVAA